jgi:hypothetical protein
LKGSNVGEGISSSRRTLVRDAFIVFAKCNHDSNYIILHWLTLSFYIIFEFLKIIIIIMVEHARPLCRE